MTRYAKYSRYASTSDSRTELRKGLTLVVGKAIYESHDVAWDVLSTTVDEMDGLAPWRRRSLPSTPPASVSIGVLDTLPTT
jgi:hypothetical protein